MNIGSASEHSGLPAKTILYYEDTGLLGPVRAGKGYRRYTMTLIHKLRILRRARRLGFSVEECRQLLALNEDKARSSADVKRLAEKKQAETDEKIADLTRLRRPLGQVGAHCQGDERPDCPILDSLSHEEAQ